MNLSNLTIDIDSSWGKGNFSFSFAQIEEGLRSGATRGVVATPAGTVVGTWRIPAPHRLNERELVEVESLNAYYADWVADLYRSDGKNREQVVAAFTGAYGLDDDADEGGEDGEHQFRNLAEWTTRKGPAHYVLHEEFRDHLTAVGRMNQRTAELLDIDLTPASITS